MKNEMTNETNIKILVHQLNNVELEGVNLKDAPDFVVAPLKKGESIRVPVFVYYTLKEGLISQIR